MSGFRVSWLDDDASEASPEIAIDITETEIPVADLIEKRAAVSRVVEFLLYLGRESEPQGNIIFVASFDAIGENASAALCTRKECRLVEPTAGPLEIASGHSPPC